jgi:hypothetical protein
MEDERSQNLASFCSDGPGGLALSAVFPTLTRECHLPFFKVKLEWLYPLKQHIARQG